MVYTSSTSVYPQDCGVRVDETAAEFHGGRTGSAEFAIGGAVNAALMNLTKVLADRGISGGERG